MAKLSILLVVIMCAVLKESHALTEEEHKEMHQIMMPLITECSEQHGTKPDDIIAVESKDVDGMDSCLIDCVFKKLGVINDDGMFVVEKFTENMKKIMKKDGDAGKVDDLAKHCVSVNDKEIDDKCGRSKALLACLMQQKDALGL
ncbi:uncharacterized protein [Choristoneura fumiferana]|uniref:uncharacterized protein n=1 Tax=Choristoneura fumiferana TaxID=7141 RepID=UPI003D15B614